MDQKYKKIIYFGWTLPKAQGKDIEIEIEIEI